MQLPAPVHSSRMGHHVKQQNSPSCLQLLPPHTAGLSCLQKVTKEFWVCPFPSLEGTLRTQFCCPKTPCAISDTLFSREGLCGAEGEAGDPQSSGKVAGG